MTKGVFLESSQRTSRDWSQKLDFSRFKNRKTFQIMTSIANGSQQDFPCFSYESTGKHLKFIESKGCDLRSGSFSPYWCQCIAIWLRGNQVKSLQWLYRVLCQIFPTLLQGLHLTPGRIIPLNPRIRLTIKNTKRSQKHLKNIKSPCRLGRSELLLKSAMRFLFSTLIQRRLFIEFYLHFRLWYNFILGCHEKTRRAINGINEWASQLTMLWRFSICGVIDSSLVRLVVPPAILVSVQSGLQEFHVFAALFDEFLDG